MTRFHSYSPSLRFETCDQSTDDKRTPRLTILPPENSLVSLIMRERNSATCDVLINRAPHMFNLTVTVAVYPLNGLFMSPWRASQRLLATSEEWADPRCQNTRALRNRPALPRTARPSSTRNDPPAPHAATLLFHVLSRHSANILSFAANCFRPRTMESLSLSWRTLDTMSGITQRSLSTPGASNPRHPGSDS